MLLKQVYLSYLKKGILVPTSLAFSVVLPLNRMLDLKYFEYSQQPRQETWYFGASALTMYTLTRNFNYSSSLCQKILVKIVMPYSIIDVTGFLTCEVRSYQRSLNASYWNICSSLQFY
jgi:hypothetical protein